MLSWANPQLRAAAVCGVIALVYVFLWPGRKNPSQVSQLPLWQRIVLRWFHSLTWLLIAVACFYWSKLPAIAAGTVYFIYLFVVSRTRALIAR
jgi:hypothetical protein